MLHMQHHFLCNISFVVIVASMGIDLKYTTIIELVHKAREGEGGGGREREREMIQHGTCMCSGPCEVYMYTYTGTHIFTPFNMC